MPNVVIFDLDGTLIDSRKDLTTAINLTRNYYKLPPLELATVCDFVGNGVRKLMERSLAKTGINIDDALPHMKKFYEEHFIDETVLYPGVVDGLRKLNASGLKLAVITNKPSQAAKLLLNKLEVDKYFDEIMGDGCGYPLKPAPDALLYFVDKWQADPKKSWMVGDHYTDLEAGNLAGLACCWASYGFGDTRDLKYNLKVESFSEFVDAAIG
ncbi:MAG: HAD-IIIA family hydrolase [Victivallaceae bacterium]|nr:HAD-IIIA family hydrolase [Victivallaceae bacterium]MDD4180776.1 HAD-IIIA family hydrolase [Victivallaceae bacterium]